MSYVFNYSFFVCLLCATIRFCRLFKLRHVMGAFIMASINHMGIKFSAFSGLEPSTSQLWAVCLMISDILWTRMCSLKPFVIFRRITTKSLRALNSKFWVESSLSFGVKLNTGVLFWVEFELKLKTRVEFELKIVFPSFSQNCHV